eukprot:1615-Heterococcus_DN1.PRE.1
MTWRMAQQCGHEPVGHSSTAQHTAVILTLWYCSVSAQLLRTSALATTTVRIQPQVQQRCQLERCTCVMRVAALVSTDNMSRDLTAAQCTN